MIVNFNMEKLAETEESAKQILKHIEALKRLCWDMSSRPSLSVSIEVTDKDEYDRPDGAKATAESEDT